MVVEVFAIKFQRTLRVLLDHIGLQLAAIIHRIARITRPVGVAIKSADAISQVFGFVQWPAEHHIGAIIGLFAIAFQAKFHRRFPAETPYRRF